MESLATTDGPEKEGLPLEESSQTGVLTQEARGLEAERAAPIAEPVALAVEIGATKAHDDGTREHQLEPQPGSSEVTSSIDEAAALQRWKTWSQNRKAEGACQTQPLVSAADEGAQAPVDGDTALEAEDFIGTPDIAMGTPDVTLDNADAEADYFLDSENPGSIFEVRVDRSTGAALGIDIETKRDSAGWDGRSLLVKGICQSGLIADWNAARSSLAIRVGDRIEGVNGVAGDIMALMLECQALRPLTLRVSRSFGVGVGCSDAQPFPSVVAEQEVCPEWRARELVADLDIQRSATAVVQAVRRASEQYGWSAVWTSQALLLISRRSTKETRKVWASDRTVCWLAEGLQREVATSADTEVLLVALEALRRMGFQEPLQQRPAVEAAVERLAGNQWCAPLATLCRLLWLEAPLGLPGLGPAMRELRAKSRELGSSEVAIAVAALHRRAVRRRPVEKNGVVARVESEKGDVQAETALLQKLLSRIAVEKVRSGFSADELMDVVLGFAELGCANDAAYRKLMQDLLVRRGELTAGELDSAKRVLKRAGVSLDTSWSTAGGIVKKQRRGGIATVQTFAPQKGHGQDEDAIHQQTAQDREIQRPEGLQYVADRVRSSY